MDTRNTKKILLNGIEHSKVLFRGWVIWNGEIDYTDPNIWEMGGLAVGQNTVKTIIRTKDFYSILKKEFPNAQISISENTLQIIMSVKFDKDIEVFEKNSISLFVEKYNNKIYDMY